MKLTKLLDMKESIKKADVLIEALPYIKRFRDKIVVVKYGGSILEDAAIRKSVFQDMVFMSFVGMKPVLVHGGGPGITKKMNEKGKTPEFVNGHRVTDKETMEITDEILSALNAEIVKEIQALGGKAESFEDKKTTFMEVEKDLTGGDLGFIGKVVDIDSQIFNRAIFFEGVIPVVSPVGIGRDAQLYNVNADSVGSAVAVSLGACKFAILTDTVGILRDKTDEKTLIPTLGSEEAELFIESGVIDGGMIPKVRAAVSAVKSRVAKAHIVDAEIPHALLLEIFTDKGIGTEIVG